MAFNAFMTMEIPDSGVRSAHPGGVNALMGDGSVRFLSDGLLLPAVHDDGEASITDGTSNTVMIGEVVPTGRTDADVDGRDFLVWQRGGSPLETGAFEIKDFSFGVENPTTIGGDTFDFQPQLTTEPTAPAQMFQQIMQQMTQGQGQGGPADAFDFTTEPTAPAGGDGQRDVLVGASGSDWFNFQPQFTTATTAPEPYMSGLADWQANYGVSGFADGHNDGGLVVDWTPGPDDNVGLPAADGLLLPY